MNTHTRNTILYSALTVSLVASYWIVRQNGEPLEPLSSTSPMIEINEQASEGFEGSRGTISSALYGSESQSGTVLVSRYSQ